jgi:hypothetical protein
MFDWRPPHCLCHIATIGTWQSFGQRPDSFHWRSYLADSYTGPERRGRTPLTVPQVARILGYAEQTVTSYLRAELLPGWRVRRSWRIDPVKFRELVDQMRKGINPFVREDSSDPCEAASGGETVMAATPRVVEADGNYPGPERRGLRPITLEWAARVLRRTPEEVMALAERWPLLAYRNRAGALMFPPSRFRTFYPKLIHEGSR